LHKPASAGFLSSAEKFSHPTWSTRPAPFLNRATAGKPCCDRAFGDPHLLLRTLDFPLPTTLSTKCHQPMEFPALAPFTVPTTPASRTGPAGQAMGKIIVDVAQMAADVQQKGLILVVEDESIIRDFVCEILGDEGFSTHSLESADEAAKFLDDHADRVSLLLTDILMPGTLNGADLANLSGNKWPQIPILIMSGHETPESSGVQHAVTFIRKPWSFGQLLDGVDKALQTRQTE